MSRSHAPFLSTSRTEERRKKPRGFIRWRSVTIEKSGVIRPVEGSTVGEICCRLNGTERITSTTSHHLKELRLAGLITMERSGKNVICRVNRAALGELLAYLSSQEQRMSNSECYGGPGPLITVTTKPRRQEQV